MKIREWQDLIESSVSAILDDITGQAAHGEVELVRSASAVLPIQVLGVPAEDCPLLANWTDRVISDDPEFMRSPDEKERAREELFDCFRGLTAARRAEPRNDIVSKLVQAEINGQPAGQRQAQRAGRRVRVPGTRPVRRRLIAFIRCVLGQTIIKLNQIWPAARRVRQR